MKNIVNEIIENEKEKTQFTAYLKIYGKNQRLLAETFENFETENEELNENALENIQNYLLEKSEINPEKVDHTLLTIDENDDEDETDD